MELSLSGHTALVTGSSSGLGSAIVQRLAAEGCAVIVHGRQRDSAERVAQGIRRTGAQATVVLGDLADEAQAAQVRDAASSHGVDVLVNNAGPFSEHDWDNVDPADWGAAYQGNVISAVRLIQGLIPAIRERGWGRVINIGSRATVTPLPNMVEYSAAKAAVVNLTVSLAQHLTGTGVTANCVSPGVILTPSLRQMFIDRSADEHHRWEDIEPSVTADYAPNPVGRLGRPEDIANAVAFLASPLADYINGVNLRVDGGMTGAT
jgi:Dehydrogenases with different specificities (related to short-chain alcohol dehydrogenases)